ncbi:hypothetical protein ASG82_27110 [Mycobacterium sp. Soil538]|nr:hypothetical protein ASG82_27110 [Mycobacterium sp. Soil538]
MTTSGPEQPFDDPGLPPPVYPPPYPGPPPPGYYSAYPAYATYPGYPPRPPGTNGKAIAALATALGGLICCGLPSIVGLVLGIIAMRETRRTGQNGFGLAVAAVVISTLLIIVGVIYFALTTLLYAGNWQWAP